MLSKYRITAIYANDTLKFLFITWPVHEATLVEDEILDEDVRK